MPANTKPTPADIHYGPPPEASPVAEAAGHCMSRWLSQSAAQDPWSPHRVAPGGHGPGRHSEVLWAAPGDVGCEGWSTRATQGSARS
ncbi:hypothetical protein GGTG_10522 [Gaeumannomyces tritici R3-111a-1]|nr:hypothetical protein GGTG_10522 [Gaeumannomyces tritici R3-111a-1]EJT71263.1 hypothetical protein GGTG_10522 [Gaeumannomyces tritici R3-111a-1]